MLTARLFALGPHPPSPPRHNTEPAGSTPPISFPAQTSLRAKDGGAGDTAISYEVLDRLLDMNPDARTLLFGNTVRDMAPWLKNAGFAIPTMEDSVMIGKLSDDIHAAAKTNTNPKYRKLRDQWVSRPRPTKREKKRAKHATEALHAFGAQLLSDPLSMPTNIRGAPVEGTTNRPGNRTLQRVFLEARPIEFVEEFRDKFVYMGSGSEDIGECTWGDNVMDAEVIDGVAAGIRKLEWEEGKMDMEVFVRQGAHLKKVFTLHRNSCGKSEADRRLLAIRHQIQERTNVRRYKGQTTDSVMAPAGVRQGTRTQAYSMVSPQNRSYVYHLQYFDGRYLFTT